MKSEIRLRHSKPMSAKVACPGQKLGKARKDSPQGHRASTACQHLDFRHLLSRRMRQKISVVLRYLIYNLEDLSKKFCQLYLLYSFF